MSHAHAENDLCRRYYDALTARGLDVWIDLRDIRKGRLLPREIQT